MLGSADTFQSPPGEAPDLSPKRLALLIVLVALAYYAAGRLGLLLPYVGSHVSLVWLPTGIAVAACWRWGRSMALGVAAGAFAVNYAIGGTVWMSTGIAAGNALGPLLTTALMRRWSFDASVTRRRDLVVYLAAIGLGMTVTATNGTAWLNAAGLLPLSQWAAAWMTWWIGDAVGALLGGIPLITLTRTTLGESFSGRDGRLNAALLMVVLLCGLIGFSSATAPPSSAMYFPLLSLPLFVTAILALRAGVFAASVAVLVLSGTAAWGTANGIGPFAGHDPHAGLLALWSYITAQACTSVLIFGLAAQLLAIRRQHSALFERASEAILVVSADHLVLGANPAARELLGLSPHWAPGQSLQSLSNAVGSPLSSLLTLRDGPASSGKEVDYLQLRRPDGTLLEVEAQFAHHLDARGQRQTQIMLRNVTERRTAEARLADSERRLREIADNAPALISKHGVDTRFKFANRAFKDWLGVAPSELIGKTLREAVGEEGFAEMAPFIDAVLKGELASFERRSAVGRRLHVELVPRLGTGGAVVGFYTFASDITARVAAEEALRRSEENYKAVLKDQHDVVCRFDGTGRVIYANEACRRLAGLGDEAFELAKWQSVVVPEDLPATLGRLKSLSITKPMVVTENRIRHAELGIRWMEFVNHVFHDTDGQVREFQTVGRDVTERKELAQRLALTSAQYQDLYDNAPCGYHSLDVDGKYIHINAVELEWLGCRREEVIGKLGTVDFLTEESQAVYRQVFPKFLMEGRIEGVEYDLVSRDGTLRRVSLSATSVRDESGRFVMTRSVLYDISETHRIRSRLTQLSREQDAMLNTDIVGIAKVKERRFVWKNTALERMLGYGPAELLGMPTRQLYLDDASYAAFGREAYPSIQAGRPYRAQLMLARKDGSTIWIDMSGAPLDDGESVWILQDITLLKQRQEHVEQIAFYDALTGLPNRVLLRDRLSQMMAGCERTESLLAVGFVDLDGFKKVNDSFGHEVGDGLLKEAARRMLGCLRGSDTVARLGGDEFVIALSPVLGKEEAMAVLTRLAAELAKPMDLGVGQAAQVSASIGLALYPDDGNSAEVLIARADEAMYLAKRAGRNQVRAC